MLVSRLSEELITQCWWAMGDLFHCLFLLSSQISLNNEWVRIEWTV